MHDQASSTATSARKFAVGEEPHSVSDREIIDFGLSKARQTRDVCACFWDPRVFGAEMLKRRSYKRGRGHVDGGVVAAVLICGCLPFHDGELHIIPRTPVKNSDRDFLVGALAVHSARLWLIYYRTSVNGRSCRRHPWLRGTAERFPCPCPHRHAGYVGGRSARRRPLPTVVAVPADYAVLDNDGRARPASRRPSVM